MVAFNGHGGPCAISADHAFTGGEFAAAWLAPSAADRPSDWVT